MADDFDGHVEIADHPADDRQLLEVLFPEDRGLGTGQQEELQHHGADTIEVAWAGGSAQVAGK